MQASESHTRNVASSDNSGSVRLTAAQFRDLLARYQTEAWPLDSLVTLCLSIQAGASVGAIGKVLCVSKNAVVGKSHRLMEVGILRRRAGAGTWAPDDPRRSENPRGTRPLPVVVGGTLSPLASATPRDDQAPLRRSGPISSPEGLSPAWSRANLDTLRAMRADNKTDAEIAAHLGKSEGAVRMKARRIGIVASPPPSRPTESRSAIPTRAARPPDPSATPRQAPEFPASQPKQSRQPEPRRPRRYLPPPVYGRVTNCSWPIGDPGTPTFHFCDIPSEPGRPYCPDHVKGAFIRIPNRQKPRDDGYARPAPPHERPPPLPGLVHDRPAGLDRRADLAGLGAVPAPRVHAMKVCTSCAGRETDGAAFPVAKRRRDAWVCTDCLALARRVAPQATGANPYPKTSRVITRASYRAALRRRRQAAQTDLVDLLVPAP